MKNPLISILIRHTEKREKKFERCMTSIIEQTYRNIEVFVSVDFEFRNNFLPIVKVAKNLNLGPYYYNDYCNELKNRCQEGYFLFLDDDDYLANPTVLEKLALHLEDNPDGVICQMSRDSGKIKPSDELISAKKIVSGKIGMPCLVLHHQHKDLANIQCCDNGDFLWINEVSKKVDLKFVHQVVIHSPNRSYGI